MSKSNIVVTRASRLKTCCPHEMVVGKFYLRQVAISIGQKSETFYAVTTKHALLETGETALDIDIDCDQVIEIGDFTAMCRWVANGRKLEDLQGDSKSEYVGADRLERGKYYTLVSGDSSLRDKIIGHVFFFKKAECSAYPVLNLTKGVGYRQDALTDCLFWPLGAGDTITITQP